MDARFNLIMPMAGRGSRFFKNGFEMPKPLIMIRKKPFFYWSTESIFKFFKNIDIIFVILREHDEKFSLSEIIKKYYDSARIISIPDVLDGAVLTVREAIKNIDNTNPILINDCDHMFMSSEFNCFINNIDESVYGALLTFNSNNSKYSFAEVDPRGVILRTREKEVISNRAICGAYYMKDKDVFINYSNRYLNNCKYDEFFVSGIYNELINDEKKVMAFNTNFHIPFGTPEEYYIAEKSEKFEVFDR